MYLAFVDLEKAFDRVSNSKTCESLKNRKTPAKLLASLYKETLKLLFFYVNSEEYEVRDVCYS